jgi:PIN domain nuclease of toxin-antitoxin system
MNLLLDTHVILWYILDDPQLPPSAKALINNLENNCFVSYTSIWEMGIKYSVGKLKFDDSFDAMVATVANSDLEIIPIELGHLMKYVELPLHHRDPFDRLLIAQAMTEKWKIVTKDEWFSKYDVEVLWK